MPLLPFGEYRPDVSDYEGQHTQNIVNVVPQGDGYGPFKAFARFTSALASQCFGIFYALKNDGSIAVFGATSTNLYLLNNTSQIWTNVSSGGGPYTAPPSGHQWQFRQFNNFVFAVQQNVAPQVYDLTSSTTFLALGGSPAPPQAAYISIVNRFVVLSGLASPNVYRVQWSGLNATTTWDNVTNQSNFQDLADGGLVRGVGGGEFGVIFQDRAIRRMTYAPGSPVIFVIEKLSQEDGLAAPYSLISSGDSVFWYSSQGFKMMKPGGLPEAIGKERVDRTFKTDYDSSNPGLFMGCADPKSQRVYWAYKSVNGASNQFDTILVYDWALDRWAKLSIAGEFLSPLATPGLTLEGVDAAYDTATAVSLESVSTSTSAVGFGKTAHGLTAGKGIIFPNAIVGLSANTPYYVKSGASLTSSGFTVSATGGVGTLEGSAVGTTSTATSTTVTATYIVSSIDTLGIGSLDDIATGSLPALAAVNTSHQVGLFTGENLEATLETGEHGDGKQRIFISTFRLAADSTSINGSVGHRENLHSATTYSSENPVDDIGQVPCRVSTRYGRAKIRITAGSTWTFAAGVIPETSLEGQR